jgi:acyl-CoA synthetase (AMP-forming)/AMP-acid ligase II
VYPGTFAQTIPDHPAIIMGGTGAIVTYRQLDERSNRLAHVFRARGLQPGDCMAIFVENQARYMEVTWAAQRAGLYCTPINSHLTAPEVEYIVDDCEARLLVSSKLLAGVAGELSRRAIPRVESCLMVDGIVGGWESYEDVVAGAPSERIPDEYEGGFAFYSSGTTGRPKGILRQLPLTPMGEAPSALQAFFKWCGFTDGDVYLSPAPLYHAAPISWSMEMHRIAGTVVLMERFDAEHALALIERYGVTCGQFVPTMFIRMLKLPEDVRARYDVSSLRSVVHAAAPCPVDIKQQMMEWWGPIIYEYYSSTEGAGATSVTPEEWLAHPGTVGKSMVGAIHILDDDGNELPAGQAGTIWGEGPLGFEYRNDPQKTAEAVNAQGYKTVGDIGYLDDEGYLYLTDRKAHMIISGGVNIYPQETENVLILHPKVFDVAVIGVPDDDLGEQVKAVVQPANWDDAGPELAAELVEYCRANLAHYKCPRSVDFERELPRLDTGKLYKGAVRALYWPAS